MKLLIDEEFGYRYWEWTPRETTAEALLKYMETIDKDFFEKWVTAHPSNLMGTWKELSLHEGATKQEEDWHFEEVLNDKNYDGSGHLHMFEDSYITINGKEHAISELCNTSSL
tara:strand:+ start:556 stop:894 length:339 start_codon:yes stop_codon:yes gene_type:complete